jgi:hypothetical protein
MVVGVIGRPKPCFDHACLEGRHDFSASELATLPKECIELSLVLFFVVAIFGLLVDDAGDPLQSLDEPEVDKVNGFVFELVLVGEAEERGKRIDLEFALPDGFGCELLQPTEVN